MTTDRIRSGLEERQQLQNSLEGKTMREDRRPAKVVEECLTVEGSQPLLHEVDIPLDSEYWLLQIWLSQTGVAP
jgi:hypothetical protein